MVDATPLISDDIIKVTSGDSSGTLKRGSIQSYHHIAGSGARFCEKSNTKTCCCHRLTKSQCFVTCCFWLLLLIATLVIVVVTCGPMIVRSELSGTKIKFTRLDITPSNNQSFLANTDLEISHVTPLDGVLEAMSVDVSYNGSSLVTIAFPELNIRAFKVNKKQINARLLEINDIEVWNDFSYGLIHSKMLEWELASKASVSSTVLGIHLHFANIPFKKKIPLTGFNGFGDFQLSIFDLTQSLPNMIILNLTVCMQNPTSIQFENLGNLFFEIQYNGTSMGPVNVTNATILKRVNDPSDDTCLKYGEHGWNSLLMTGNLLPSNVAVAKDLMSRYFSGTNTNVTAVSLAPACSIELFDYSLEGLELSTVLTGNTYKLLTELKFSSVLITPNTSTSLTMTMDISISVSNPLGNTSPINIISVDMTVALWYNKSYVGTALTGPTKVPKPNTVIGEDTIRMNTSAEMRLNDQGIELAKFATDLTKVKTMELDLDGSSRTEVFSHALGWSIDVEALPVDITVTFPGMNGLRGVKILEYSLSGNVPDDTDGCKSLCGVYLTLRAELFNPSPFGLVIGELNCNVANMDGVMLGKVGTTNLTLDGNSTNALTMAGRLAPKNLTAAASFMSTYMSKVSQITKIVGLDAGSSQVNWLQMVAKTLELKAQFPGADDRYQMLAECEIWTLSMAISEDGIVTVAGKISALFQLPEQVSSSVVINIKTLTMQFELIDIKSSLVLGKVSVDTSTVAYNKSVQIVTITFEAAKMVVKNENKFEDLLVDLLTLPSKTVRFSGIVSPNVATNMGMLQLKNVPFTVETVLYGVNSFLDEKTEKSLIHVESIDVVNGKDGALDLLLDVSVTNPGNIALSIGKTILQLWTSTGYYLGDLTILNFNLKANSERSAVTQFHNIPAIIITPTNRSAIAAQRLFLSNWLSGVDQIADLRGTTESSSISILKPVFAIFSTFNKIPGLNDRMIRKGTLTLLTVNVQKLPTVLEVHNPFSAILTITAAHAELVACKQLSDDAKRCSKYFDSSLGYYTPDKIVEEIPPELNWSLGPHSSYLYSIFSSQVFQVLMNSISVGSFVNVKGTLDITVGDFSTQLDYFINDVPICIKFLWHTCESFLATNKRVARL